MATASAYSAISGRWRTDRVRPADRPAPLGKANPGIHMKFDATPPGSRPPRVRKERRDIAPPGVIDQGEEWDQVRPREAPGLVLDREPYGDHNVGTVGGGYRKSRPNYARRLANAARDEDRGAAAEEIYQRPDLRRFDEVYSTPRRELLPSDDGSRIGALRGRNSLLVNNPEGFRNGFRIQRFVERRLWQRRRSHDIRGIRDHLAAAPIVSPPPEGYNRYTSPYAWNVKSRARNLSSPIMRRVPERWDTPIQAEDTEASEIDEYAPTYQSWGL